MEIDDEFEELMKKAPEWLDEFIQNQDDPNFLKNRINLPAWIHLSESRLSNLLDQIDRTKNTTKSKAAHKGWPQIVSKFKGTARADSIYAILEYGLRNAEALRSVLELLIHLIAIPSVRLKLEPLIHDTLFMVRLPDRENNLIDLLEYYLSFQCTIDEGTLSWSQVRKKYNDKILRFQSCIFSNLTPEQQMSETSINPLVSATENQLNDIEFLQQHLSELDPNIFEKLKEEFGIIPRNVTPAESKNLSIAGLARMLIAPINPLESIPHFLMPTKLPPSDIVYPTLEQHALCIEDAILQVFQEKRVIVSDKVMHFIDEVKNELDKTEYSKHCCPLLVPAAISTTSSGYEENSCFSIILDSQFLNYDFTSPKKGDMIYLYNSENGIICPFIVIESVSNNSFIAHLEADKLPDQNFDIAIKLIDELRYDVERLIQLPKILASPHISEKVVDSFIGMANKTAKPSITVVDSTLCRSPESDAAFWLADENLEGPFKKTIVFGTNSKQLDLFISSFCLKYHEKKGERFPAMNILRLDFQTDVGIEIALRSRQILLDEVAKIDPSYAFSCASAINSLTLYRESLIGDKSEVNALLKQLEFIRPLEYIADSEKRIEYLKKSSQIICHLIEEPLKIKEMLKFHNCIILDSCIIEDSDLLWIMNQTNPHQIRLYGKGKAFNRLSLMADDVIQKEDVNLSIRKSDSIMEFLGFKPNQESKMAPGVLSTCHVWFENDISKSIEVSVASLLLLNFLGYENIIVVTDKSEIVNRLELTLLRRTAWNRQLADKLKNKFYLTDYAIRKNLMADAVIFLETSKLDDTRVAEMANAASLIFWNIQCPQIEEGESSGNILRLYDNSTFIFKLSQMFDEVQQSHNQTMRLALNENYADLNNLNMKREVYEINDVDDLLGLVYSMQIQLFNEKKEYMNTF